MGDIKADSGHIISLLVANMLFQVNPPHKLNEPPGRVYLFKDVSP